MDRIARALVATLALCVLSWGARAQQSSAVPEAGRGLFERYQCWQCHGTEGQGGVGPRLARTVYPFEAFAQLVRHPNLMPAYSPNELADESLRQIWQFLRTRPEPPAIEDIPALNAY